MRFVAGLVVGAAAGFVAAALVSAGGADSGERGEVLPSGTLRTEGDTRTIAGLYEIAERRGW